VREFTKLTINEGRWYKAVSLLPAMQSTVDTEPRSEKSARPIETKRELAEFQEHLRKVTESTAFRSSHRSAQFLNYICEQAIAGHFDSLKERVIGAKLFGRPPAYDTGEDAIVRVTASDVRKRLSHYYLSTTGSSSELRINLPVGSYVPEFTRDIQDTVATKIAETNPEPPAPEAPSTVTIKPETHFDPSDRLQRSIKSWLMIATCIACLSFLGWLIFRKSPAQESVSRTSVLPWSVFFADKRVPLLVTSDPNIAEIQGLTGQPVSVSDYANQKYVPDAASLSPEIIHVCRDILRGDKAASVDTPIVAGIAELAAENASRINVRAARDLHFSDLDTDGNLIFLGSPRTDPWTSLFEDQLDFRFIYDHASRQEIIQNVRPRPGEPEKYVPTAKGFATGQSFASVSFVRNPNHSGHVLILAGANAEGTKAAGELVTNPSSLSSALQGCGVRSSTTASDTGQYFQLLLHLKMMAGSPTAFDVAACHILP
jgi:hypothetical protein